MPERSPAMSQWLRDLGRNLRSGALLVFAQPVSKLGFRIGVPQLLVLFFFSAWLDLAVDTVRREPGAAFVLNGLIGEGFYGGLVVLFAGGVGVVSCPPPLLRRPAGHLPSTRTGPPPRSLLILLFVLV